MWLRWINSLIQLVTVISASDRFFLFWKLNSVSYGKNTKFFHGPLTLFLNNYKKYQIPLLNTFYIFLSPAAFTHHQSHRVLCRILLFLCSISFIRIPFKIRNRPHSIYVSISIQILFITLDGLNRSSKKGHVFQFVQRHGATKRKTGDHTSNNIAVWSKIKKSKKYLQKKLNNSSTNLL